MPMLTYPEKQESYLKTHIELALLADAISTKISSTGPTVFLKKPEKVCRPGTLAFKVKIIP